MSAGSGTHAVSGMAVSSVAVSGIVLAAGASRRLAGTAPKQLLELAGETLIRRVVRAALTSRLADVVVVLGHASRAVAGALEGLDVRTVENPDYQRGQSTSVRAGLAAVAAGSRAALFIPADQPLLSTRLIDRILDVYAAAGRPIVLPVCAGRRGSPVLFDRSLFGELEALEGDTGGRSVLDRYRTSIAEVPVDDAFELADVDTEADLERLAAELRGRAPRGAV